MLHQYCMCCTDQTQQVSRDSRYVTIAHLADKELPRSYCWLWRLPRSDALRVGKRHNQRPAAVQPRPPIVRFLGCLRCRTPSERGAEQQECAQLKIWPEEGQM